jgi:SOS-response transcriptional repressor LexA
MRIRANWRKLLAGLVDAKGGNKKALSLAAGLNETYLRDVLDRGQTPSARSAQKLSDALDVGIADWFLEPMAALRSVPLINYVQAGNWSEVADIGALGPDVEWVTCDSKVGEHAFALRIRGRSMEERFRENDVVIFDPDVQPTPGDFVVAKPKAENEATFKLYRQRSTKEIELLPLNDNFAKLTIDAKNPGRIIAPMIEHHSYRRA